MNSTVLDLVALSWSLLNGDGIIEHCLDNGTVLPMENRALAATLILEFLIH